MAGLPVSWLLVSAGLVQLPQQDKLLVYISMLLWFPLIEELAFRGLIQGRLSLSTTGKRAWLGISLANLGGSSAFVVWHLLYQPTLFVLTLMVPSLVFGFFRDRYNSLLPGLILHVVYNGVLLLVVELAA